LETYLSKVRALENVAFQASGYFLWVARPQVVSLLLLLIDVRKREREGGWGGNGELFLMNILERNLAVVLF
jgi:hypothetical protein